MAQRPTFVQLKTGYDIYPDEWFWLSAAEHDRTDLRYGPWKPQVDEGSAGL